MCAGKSIQSLTNYWIVKHTTVLAFYERCIKPIYKLNFKILEKWCIRESASKYGVFKKITEHSLWFTKCSNTKISCSIALTCPMLMGSNSFVSINYIIRGGLIWSRPSNIYNIQEQQKYTLIMYVFTS